jgi:hypothetical protein
MGLVFMDRDGSKQQNLEHYLAFVPFTEFVQLSRDLLSGFNIILYKIY